MTTTSRDAGNHPSAWVRRFVSQIPTQGVVLDLACGSGRHTRLSLELGHPVVALDRDLTGVADLRGQPDLELVEVDLEDGRAFPLAGQTFAGVVVTNYLHRPLLPDLVAAVAPGGALIYETFAANNEALAGPSNPNFLLRPGELLETVRGHLRVVAYEDTIDAGPPGTALQRIAATRVASNAAS